MLKITEKIVCKTYVEELFEKRKNLASPYFMGLCEVIYHSPVYTCDRCHMDATFRTSETMKLHKTLIKPHKWTFENV